MNVEAPAFVPPSQPGLAGATPFNPNVAPFVPPSSGSTTSAPSTPAAAIPSSSSAASSPVSATATATAMASGGGGGGKFTVTASSGVSPPPPPLPRPRGPAGGQTHHGRGRANQSHHHHQQQQPQPQHVPTVSDIPSGLPGLSPDQEQQQQQSGWAAPPAPFGPLPPWLAGAQPPGLPSRIDPTRLLQQLQLQLQQQQQQQQQQQATPNQFNLDAAGGGTPAAASALLLAAAGAAMPTLQPKPSQGALAASYAAQVAALQGYPPITHPSSLLPATAGGNSATTTTTGGSSSTSADGGGGRAPAARGNQPHRDSGSNSSNSVSGNVAREFGELPKFTSTSNPPGSSISNNRYPLPPLPSQEALREWQAAKAGKLSERDLVFDLVHRVEAQRAEELRSRRKFPVNETTTIEELLEIDDTMYDTFRELVVANQLSACSVSGDSSGPFWHFFVPETALLAAKTCLDVLTPPGVGPRVQHRDEFMARGSETLALNVMEAKLAHLARQYLIPLLAAEQHQQHPTPPPTGTRSSREAPPNVSRHAATNATCVRILLHHLRLAWENLWTPSDARQEAAAATAQQQQQSPLAPEGATTPLLSLTAVDLERFQDDMQRACNYATHLLYFYSRMHYMSQRYVPERLGDLRHFLEDHPDHGAFLRCGLPLMLMSYVGREALTDQRVRTSGMMRHFARRLRVQKSTNSAMDERYLAHAASAGAGTREDAARGMRGGGGGGGDDENDDDATAEDSKSSTATRRPASHSDSAGVLEDKGAVQDEGDEVEEAAGAAGESQADEEAEELRREQKLLEVKEAFASAFPTMALHFLGLPRRTPIAIRKNDGVDSPDAARDLNSWHVTLNTCFSSDSILLIATMGDVLVEFETQCRTQDQSHASELQWIRGLPEASAAVGARSADLASIRTRLHLGHSIAPELVVHRLSVTAGTLPADLHQTVQLAAANPVRPAALTGMHSTAIVADLARLIDEVLRGSATETQLTAINVLRQQQRALSELQCAAAAAADADAPSGYRGSEAMPAAPPNPLDGGSSPSPLRQTSAVDGSAAAAAQQLQGAKQPHAGSAPGSEAAPTTLPATGAPAAAAAAVRSYFASGGADSQQQGFLMPGTAHPHIRVAQPHTSSAAASQPPPTPLPPDAPQQMPKSAITSLLQQLSRQSGFTARIYEQKCSDSKAPRFALNAENSLAHCADALRTFERHYSLFYPEAEAQQSADPVADDDVVGGAIAFPCTAARPQVQHGAFLRRVLGGPSCSAAVPGSGDAKSAAAAAAGSNTPGPSTSLAFFTGSDSGSGAEAIDVVSTSGAIPNAPQLLHMLLATLVNGSLLPPDRLFQIVDCLHHVFNVIRPVLTQHMQQHFVVGMRRDRDGGPSGAGMKSAAPNNGGSNSTTGQIITPELASLAERQQRMIECAILFAQPPPVQELVEAAYCLLKGASSKEGGGGFAAMPERHVVHRMLELADHNQSIERAKAGVLHMQHPPAPPGAAKSAAHYDGVGPTRGGGGGSSSSNDGGGGGASQAARHRPATGGSTFVAAAAAATTTTRATSTGLRPLLSRGHAALRGGELGAHDADALGLRTVGEAHDSAAGGCEAPMAAVGPDGYGSSGSGSGSGALGPFLQMRGRGGAALGGGGSGVGNSSTTAFDQGAAVHGSTQLWGSGGEGRLSVNTHNGTREMQQRRREEHRSSEDPFAAATEAMRRLGGGGDDAEEIQRIAEAAVSAARAAGYAAEQEAVEMGEEEVQQQAEGVQFSEQGAAAAAAAAAWWMSHLASSSSGGARSRPRDENGMDEDDDDDDDDVDPQQLVAQLLRGQHSEWQRDQQSHQQRRGTVAADSGSGSGSSEASEDHRPQRQSPHCSDTASATREREGEDVRTASLFTAWRADNGGGAAAATTSAAGGRGDAAGNEDPSAGGGAAAGADCW